MKKIVIFGATGKTGRELVKQGTERGHAVTAFVRNPKRLPFHHLNLRLVTGDVLDSETLATAVAGQDAVLVALGSRSLGKTSVRATGTRHIVAAMHQHGVRRLIVMTSLGVGESYTQLSWLPRLTVRTVLRNVIADHAAQEDIVTHSNLDWTIVRPGGLNDGAYTGQYIYGLDPNLNPGSISRADVADFMLKQLESTQFVGQTPVIT